MNLFSAWRKKLFLPLLAAAALSGSGCRDGSTPPFFSRLQELDSPRVTIGGMTGIVATREARARLPRARVTEYPMPIDAFTALCARRIDAVVLDRPTLEFMALAHPELAVMPEDLAVGRVSVAAARRNGALMAQVNSFIRHYREDGTYRQMVDRWFHTTGEDLPPLPVPAAPSGVLKVGVTANNEPLCFWKNGHLAGFDAEFSLRFAARTGRQVEFVDLPYDALVIALESGKIDLAVAYMDVQPERKDSVLFSDSYVDAPITLLVHRTQLRRSTGAVGFPEGLRRSFVKTLIRENRWQLILQGLGVTLFITLLAVLAGSVMGYFICQACRSRHTLLVWLGERYVSFLLGTPVLVVLLILYYVVFARVDVPAVAVAVTAFALEFAAGFSVALRSGIDAVPRGQFEAALALGHPPAAAFRRFILPQAVRTALPVCSALVINTLKGTAIVGYVAVMDLTKMGDIIRSRTYEAFFPLIIIAAIYFLTAKALAAGGRLLERRLDPGARRLRLKNSVHSFQP